MADKIPPVPFVFYDIISRLPAGLLICAILHWCLTGRLVPSALTTNGADGWALLSILVLTLSYVVGLAASAPAFLLHLIMDSCMGYILWSMCGKRNQLKNAGVEMDGWRQWLMLPVRMRRLRGEAESVRVRDVEGYRQITKHNAEAALFGNLVGGLTLGWIIVELWFTPVTSECIASSQPDSRSKVVLLILILGLLALFARTYFWWVSFLITRKISSARRDHCNFDPKVG